MTSLVNRLVANENISKKNELLQSLTELLALEASSSPFSAEIEQDLMRTFGINEEQLELNYGIIKNQQIIDKKQSQQINPYQNLFNLDYL